MLKGEEKKKTVATAQNVLLTNMQRRIRNLETTARCSEVIRLDRSLGGQGLYSRDCGVNGFGSHLCTSTCCVPWPPFFDLAPVLLNPVGTVEGTATNRFYGFGA